MRKILDAEISVDSMKLKQMGGIVKIINSKMCYVNFNIKGLKIAYAYNVNKDGKYFLERILPYPLPIKEYDAEAMVVDVIKLDVEQFRNALNSHNIDEFIEVSKQINISAKIFEDLFLHYNVPCDNLKLIHEKLNELDELIEETKSFSKKIYEDDSINV